MHRVHLGGLERGDVAARIEALTGRPAPQSLVDEVFVRGQGNPFFTRNFNPYLTNTRTASRWIYEPLILVNPLDNTLNRLDPVTGSVVEADTTEGTTPVRAC